MNTRLSVREIARSCGLPPSTVSDYLVRAQAAGLSWPLPEGLDDQQIQEQLLRANPAQPEAATARAAAPVARLARSPQGTGPSFRDAALALAGIPPALPRRLRLQQFCELYQRWAETLDPVMRHVHPPGEKMFVDWAGQTVPIHEPDGRRFRRPPVRGGAGRQQQDLRRSLREPEAAGLDRRSLPCLRVL